MAGLGKYTCGLDAAMAVVSGKWVPLILWELSDGPVRFNTLHRNLVGISQKMLTQHLKDLQAYGVVHRESYHEVPPRVEYSMTPAGRELLEALEPMAIGPRSTSASSARPTQARSRVRRATYRPAASRRVTATRPESARAAR